MTIVIRHVMLSKQVTGLTGPTIDQRIEMKQKILVAFIYCASAGLEKRSESYTVGDDAGNGPLLSLLFRRIPLHQDETSGHDQTSQSVSSSRSS